MTDAVRPIVSVAIPARDEADRIVGCLEAINNQFGAPVDHIVLVANNCTDRTATIARGIQLRSGTTLHIHEHTLPAHLAHAGHARRTAMQRAAVLVGRDGIILTTDADGQVDPDWLMANLAVMQRGADVVCGWVELDRLSGAGSPLSCMKMTPGNALTTHYATAYMLSWTPTQQIHYHGIRNTPVPASP